MGDRALINQSYGGRQSLLDGEAIMGAMGGAQGGGTPTPAPTFTVQPQVSPASGTAGTTTFTATPGTVSNGTISSRAWLLNGSSTSSGLTASPVSEGTLTYQEFASGPGGSASSAIQSVTVAAAGGALAVSRPNVVTTDFWNIWGDSTIFGVGAPTGSDMVTQMRGLVTSGPAAQGSHGQANNAGAAINTGGSNGNAILYFGNNGTAGETTPQISARVTALQADATYGAEMNRPQVFSGGLNNYNSVSANFSTTLGFGKDWPSVVKSDLASEVSKIGGSKPWLYILAPAETIYGDGMRFGADHAFHRRDMIATHGAKILNLHRYLRDYPQPSTVGTTAANSGPDYTSVQFNGTPPVSLRGGSAVVNVAYNDAPPIISANTAGGSPSVQAANFQAANGLAFAEGQIGYDSTNLTTMRKVGASGAGAWEAIDGKHFGAPGYALMARMVADAIMATQGTGPPNVAPQEFLTTVDVAANALVGQLVYLGTATSFALTTDRAGTTPSTLYAISSTGAITRTSSGTLTDGMTTLYVWAGNSTGMLRSVVDIYVDKPAAAAPGRFLTTGSGVALHGRGNYGLANGTVFSGAFLVNIASLAVQPYLANLAKGAAGNTAILFQVSSAGRLRIVGTNAANATGINVTSAASPSIAANTWTWVLFSFDLATPQASCYFNDTASSLATTSFVNSPFNFSDTQTQLLASRAPSEYDDGLSVLQGGFGPMLLFPGYIDWSVAANRRALFNADATFTPAVRTPFSAVGGVVPTIDTSAGFGRTLYGPGSGPSLVIPSYRARLLMSVAP